jgi:hypothetical protein
MAGRHRYEMGQMAGSGSTWPHSSLGLDRKDHQAGKHAMTEAIDRWLQRWMWLANLTILLSFVIIATYAADRVAPYKIIESEPLEVVKGQTATFKAKVWRDPSRACSADFSRFIFDSFGARHDLGNSMATAAMINAMEKKTPGRLVLAIEIPPGVAPGPATMITTLHYRCNKVHALWPIEVTTELPFTVLP